VVYLVLISLIPLWTAYQHHNFLNDDTYITLTYAKNLAVGRGFVFNAPPSILGTTTPLLTLTVAGLASVFRHVDLAFLAVFFTAFCWAGIAWVFFAFRRSWGITEWQALLIGLVVIASGWITFLGMEAYLFALLLVLSLSLFYSKRHFLAGICTGSLFLTRGEGVLLLIILLPLSLISDWLHLRKFGSRTIRPSIYLLAGFLLPVLPWLAYAFTTFGQVLPNTLAAKQAQGVSGNWRSLPVRLVLEWIPTWGRQFAIREVPMINFWWVLVLVGTVSAVVRKRRWTIWLLWIALYVLGYTLLRVSAYWWYQLPILFVLDIFFALGLIQGVESMIASKMNRGIAIGASIAFVSIMIFTMGKPTVNSILSYQGDPRSASYLELAEWIRNNTQAAESIAFIEVGYLGYYTDNPIVDLAGLVTADIVPHLAQGDSAWGFWYYKPDYYIYLPDFDWALAGIRSDPRFDREYQRVAVLSGPRQTDFVIYKHSVSQ
jgi:hypothetical protein